MNENHNLRMGRDNSPPENDQYRDQNGSSPKSYYYDDSTGYEIYNDPTDVDDEDEVSQDESTDDEGI